MAPFHKDRTERKVELLVKKFAYQRKILAFYKPNMGNLSTIYSLSLQAKDSSSRQREYY
jgi:hypothetical protein